MIARILGILWCSLLTGSLALAGDPVPAHDAEIGRTGVWIRTPHAEAFVTADPRPQVLAFRVVGGKSPYLIADHPYIGARGLFLERGQPQAWRNFQPSQRAGVFEEVRPDQVSVVGPVDPGARVQYLLHARLDPEKPILRLRHGYRNCDDQPRDLAAWSLTSFSQAGTAVIPWASPEPGIRTFTLFSSTRVDESCFDYGTQALAVNLAPSEPLARQSVKVGVRSEAGWAAVVRDDAVLIIRSPYERDGIYPEGGSNITVYKSWEADPAKRDQKLWAEVEHVGPYRRVPPQEVVWIEETQELYPPLTAPPPPAADDLLLAVEQAARRLSEPQP